MVEAKGVLRETREVLQKTEGRIRSHRYFDELAGGKVSREALKAFPGHQYHMWKSDLRSAAGFMARFGDRPCRAFFSNLLQGETEAGDGIVTLARKLNMTEEDLEKYEPSAMGFAYSAYVAWLASYGSAAEAACAFALNLAAWGDNCGRVSQALRDTYGFAREDTVFLDGFAGLPSLEADALEIIRDDLRRGVSAQEIVRAARLLQSYEEMFWDAMLAIAETTADA